MKEKSNFETLKNNREGVLAFANSVISLPLGGEGVDRKTLEDAKNSLGVGDFSSAITVLDEIKDNNVGIVWHESEALESGTRVLVRDARNVDTEKVKNESGEKYAMQILNEVRGAIDLLDKESLDGEKSRKAQEQLKQLANESLEEIEKLPQKIKEYNTIIVHLLNEAGIEDAAKKLKFAKEVANLKDEHRHIVTLTSAQDSQGQDVTVIEADVMLNGLTATQTAQWKAISKTSRDNPQTELTGMAWYNEMPNYKQDLLRDVAADVSTGKKLLPTQLIGDVPGLKNAYQKVTAVCRVEGVGKILSQTLHCGAPATKIKIADKAEKQGYVDEAVSQLKTFVAEEESLNLNILTSKTPFDNRGENFVHQQLDQIQDKKVKKSASPINKWQVFGAGKNHSEFKNTLNEIGSNLPSTPNTHNIGWFLKRGSSTLENIAEKLSFGKYKSTETRAKQEMDELIKGDNYELGNVLKEAMNARNLIDSSSVFTKGNLNLRVVASMNIVESSVKLEGGALNNVLNNDVKNKISERVDFCKSGKDRTGYVQTKNTHAVVCHYLGVNPSSEMGEQNMLSQVSGGHTQEMAGIQGGSTGCHSIKTNPEFALSNDPQDKVIDGIINQKSSHFNSKVKVEKNEKKSQAIVRKFREKISKSSSNTDEPGIEMMSMSDFLKEEASRNSQSEADRARNNLTNSNRGSAVNTRNPRADSVKRDSVSNAGKPGSGSVKSRSR